MATGRVSKVKGKVVDIPNAPTIGTATAGGESVSIAFTAYSGGAGGPTRSYIAKSNPGNITATGSTSPINVTGLTAGTSYTISVAGVNETGTGEYSSASGSATPTEATSYESIATVTVGSGGSSTVEFTSIPQTYKHLQIRSIARVAANATEAWTLWNLNGDTNANNYYGHYLFGQGATTVTSYYLPPTDSLISGRAIGSSAGGDNNFAPNIMDILDYTNTNKYKVTRTFAGQDNNGTRNLVILISNLWKSTSAITSIKLYADTNFTQYSSFALYGIKGA